MLKSLRQLLIKRINMIIDFHIYIHDINSPMDGSVFGNTISDLYFNIVTFMDSNGRPWILPIHCQQWLCVAQTCYLLPLNLETKTTTLKAVYIFPPPRSKSSEIIYLNLREFG